jgi:hypothetical protein
MRAVRDRYAFANATLPLALAVAAAALFFGGGTTGSALPWLTLVVGVALVLLVSFAGLPRGAWKVAPLAMLGVWAAISITWSVEPDRTWTYANRTLLYAAVALLGTYLAGRERKVAAGLAMLLGAVCIWALAGKVFAGLYPDYGRVARLRSPVGYWNGLALLGDIALPLALWMARSRRLLGAALAFGWLVALALTYSRAGVAIALVIVVLYASLGGGWWYSSTTLAVAAIPAGAVVAVAFALPGVTSDGQAGHVRSHDGLIFGVVLVGGLLATAVLARVRIGDPPPGVRRAVLIVAGVLSVIVLAVVATHASGWWSSFTSTQVAEVGNGGGRFGDTSSNHRYAWWTQAWQAFEANPIGGTGAGTFAVTNLRYRTSYLDQAVEPHDVPVQFLSETGVIGAALVLLTVLFFHVGIRARRDGVKLALGLALPAFALHALVDIDWDFVALCVPVHLIAGMLAGTPVRRKLSGGAALASAGIAALLVLSTFSVWFGERYASRASEALGTPAHAVSLARTARSFDPLAVDPILTQAVASWSGGALDTARGYYLQAVSLQPHDADAWYQLGWFDLHVRHCARAALPELDRFTALDPQNRNNVEYDAALKLVNSGTPRC